MPNPVVDIVRIGFLVGLPLFGVAILAYFYYELILSPAQSEENAHRE